MSTTARLYYDSSTLREFDAVVVRSEARDARCAVWLDRTAFYPTSGGQPYDLGTLAGARVVDVQDEQDGDIVHIVEGACPAPGAAVHGAIDWLRRADHMQQHTGQHLLSAVCADRFGWETVSVHFGAESSTSVTSTPENAVAIVS